MELHITLDLALGGLEVNQDGTVSFSVGVSDCKLTVSADGILEDELQFSLAVGSTGDLQKPEEDVSFGVRDLSVGRVLVGIIDNSNIKPEKYCSLVN